MRKININNPEELKRFKQETSGFVSSYGFPYRLDDVTEKGANYTVFCPIRWKSAFSPAKLHKLLKEDVDADKIHVEYIDFVKEGAKWQEEQIMKDAIEREVKEDAGGYPFIEATELYDYDNDKPLAKAGDKVKVLIVKDK